MSFQKFFIASAVFAASTLAQNATVTVDATQTGTPIKSVWTWHGYDEGNYTNTQPSKDLLQSIVASSRDPVYIRVHFLLNNSSGAPGLKWGSTDVYTEPNGVPTYNWTVLDSISDAIVNLGAYPYFDIAFMPQSMTVATGSYRNSTYTALDGGLFYPPKDYTKWATLIRNVVQHSKDRYPDVESKWVWELWNEPDIGYWHGTAAEYQKLFDYTEQAVHAVLPNAQLSGPEMAGAGNIGPFLTHCATGTNGATGTVGTRLDQVSFHAKGGTAVVSGHVEMSLRNQLMLHRTGFNAVATNSGGVFKNKPIVVGEADPDGCAACPISTTPANAYRNVPAYGAYEVAMMKHSLYLADSLGVNLRALLAWAWEFNDSTQPFIDGYRDMANNGIHKPVLNALKMLGRLHGNRVPLQSSAALGLNYILNNSGAMRGTQAPDIDGFATQSDSMVQVLLYNYHDDIVQVTPAAINLTIKVPSTFPSQVYVTHWRMDTTHSNANTKWIAMGKPNRPTSSQLDTLHKYMQLETLSPVQTVAVSNGQISLSFALPRHGVSLIEVTPTLPVNVMHLPPDSRMIVQHSSTLEVNLNEAYTVRVMDVSGRQIFTANGTGKQQFALAGLLRQGIYRVEVRTTRNAFSRWISGI